MQLNAIDGWIGTGFKPGGMGTAAVVVRAEGQWNVRRAGDQYGIRNADGGRDDTGAVYIVKVHGQKAYPYHDGDAKMGQLIGKIGADGNAFLIGKFYKFRRDEFSKIGGSEQLFLRINYPDEWMTTPGVVHGHLNVKFTNSDDRDLGEVVHYFDRVAGRYVRAN